MPINTQKEVKIDIIKYVKFSYKLDTYNALIDYIL